MADFNVVKGSTTAVQKTGTAKLLFRCASQMGLKPAWITPNGLFVINHHGHEIYINLSRSPLNSHTSTSLARDKHATRLILERNKLPNIAFLRAGSHAAAAEFLSTHHKIIAKPVYGSGSHDIHIVTDISQLEALHITDYILEKYIAGEEMRYLVLQGSVIGVHQSEYGTSVDEHRPLQRISYPEEAWDALLVALSIRVNHVLGLQFGAVDFLIDEEGRPYILEVNTMPGFKWFHAPSSGPVVNVAYHFLEAIISDTTHPARHLQPGMRPTIDLGYIAP